MSNRLQSILLLGTTIRTNRFIPRRFTSRFLISLILYLFSSPLLSSHAYSHSPSHINPNNLYCLNVFMFLYNFCFWVWFVGFGFVVVASEIRLTWKSMMVLVRWWWVTLTFWIRKLQLCGMRVRPNSRFPFTFTSMFSILVRHMVRTQLVSLIICCVWFVGNVS